MLRFPQRNKHKKGQQASFLFFRVFVGPQVFSVRVRVHALSYALGVFFFVYLFILSEIVFKHTGHVVSLKKKKKQTSPC